MKKNYWLKIGCFLSGYNYAILNECSEVSKKYVKRITSALLIITLIWSFIGFKFFNSYIGSGFWGSIGGALICAIIIINIERQIILGRKSKGELTEEEKKSNFRKWLSKYDILIFRLLLGIIVAFIGSFILDQSFFHDDIINNETSYLDNRVNEAVRLIEETQYKQNKDYQNTIDSLSKRISENRIAINKEGAVKIFVSKKSLDTSGRTLSSENGVIENPKLIENTNIQNQINTYTKLITTNNDSLIQRRINKQNELKNQPIGFLSELEITWEIITKSNLSKFVYTLFFLFFVFIELFIVMAKIHDGENDYDVRILHQEKSKINNLN
jgi:hypothetical protein